MSSKGYIDAILNQLPPETKKALSPAFDHVLDDPIIGTAAKAANFRWVRIRGTTHATAGTEFSIVHSLGVIPTWVIGGNLDLSQVGSQTVPLTVSRAPDEARIYLTSTSTSAAFTVLVEY